MPKTKSKPVAKKSSKGDASKQPKKKSMSSTPPLKDQGKAVEDGSAAPLPPKTAKKKTTTKAMPEPDPAPAPAPHAVTYETTPAVALTEVTLPDATTPVESVSVVAPAPVVETPARGASEEASPAGATSVLEPVEPRVPPVGTVLRRFDRRGVLRCEATVVENGVSYAGKVYRSLSAAAIAAARDLGLTSKAMNGRTWFGLTKPARSGAGRDPVTALQRSFERHTALVEALLEKAKAGEHREPVLARLLRHARVLQNLHDEVA